MAALHQPQVARTRVWAGEHHGCEPHGNGEHGPDLCPQLQSLNGRRLLEFASRRV